MKILKLTAIILLGGVLSAITYANVRTVSPTARLEKVHLVSFALKGALSDEARKELQKNISSTKGVTACTINREGNVAAMVFHPNKISEDILKNKLTASGEVQAEKIVFPEKGGCPIHAMNSSFSSVISALDFRN